MITNLGMVRPGSTIQIPVNTFDSNDPAASVTATNWANTDCHVHKDGGTTQRASSSGETLSINFDSITGNHILEIDLADNTTANFYEAGSRYAVRIEGVTVDGATINAWIGMWSIGYPGATVNTTVATLASQTSFTLEDASADDDAYNGWTAVIHDLASAIQVAAGYVSDYTGSSKTVTLSADPGVFTMAVGDNISLFPPVGVGAWNNVALATTNPLPNAAADAAGGLAISDAGGLDLDAKLANTNEVTVARMGALTDWINGGRLDLLLDAIKAVTDALPDSGALSSLATASALSTVDGNVDAILVDTGTTLDGKLNTIDSNVDAILVDTGTTLPATLGTPSDLGGGATLADNNADLAGATFDTSTDSQEAIRNRGDAEWTTGAGGSAPTAADIRAEIDSNSTQLAAIVADTNELQTDDVPGLIAGLNDLSAAAVNAEVDTALANYDAPTKAEMDSGLAALNDLDSSAVQTAAAAALTAYDPPTKAELDSAVSPLSTSTALATVDSNVDAIKAKTDDLTFTKANELDANIQSVNGTTVTGDGSLGTEWGP